MIRETLDRRGVSEVIGSILVFGLVVALLTILQTQAVPNTNADIEFQHSQQVQGDFARLSDAVTRSAVRGTSETVTLETGTSYPNRLVLFNPPPATGQLRTDEEASVYIANVAASDEETRDYLFGSLGVGNVPLTTARLSYRPQYNQYQEAPITGSEYGAVYDRHAERTLVEQRIDIVEGKDIDLRFLEGEYRESGLMTTVRTEPASAAGPPVSVVRVGEIQGVGNSPPLTLNLPTDLPEEVWSQELLADAIDDPGGANGDAPEQGDTCGVLSGGLATASAIPAPESMGGPARDTPTSFGSPDPGNDRYVANCLYIDDSDGQNYILIEFEPGVEYSLRMAKVGFDRAEDPGPQYVAPTRPSVSVGSDDTERVSVQVRDRYNNPVGGVELTASLSTAGNAPATTLETATASGTSVPVTTNEDGLATVTLSAGDAFESGQVSFTGSFSAATSTDEQEATVLVSATRAQPMTLTDAAITDDDTVVLTLENAGVERTVSKVQLVDAHIVDRKTALTSSTGDSTAEIAGISFGVTDVTNQIDGPEAIEGVYIGDTSGSFSFVSTASPATEGEAPQAVDTSALERIQNGQKKDVALQLDSALPTFTESEDAAVVRVTLTFSDGQRETYALRLESDDDDVR